MTRIRVCGFQIFRDRHGKMRAYHRRSGTPIDLTKAPLGSAEFFAECARITALKAIATPAKPGTLGMLVSQYRANASFTDLAPHTRRDYERMFEYLRPINDTPLARFDRPLVVGIRDKAGQRGRRFGNYVKAVLSVLFSWAVERGLMDGNPALLIKSIRRKRGTPEANRPWSDSERHAVLDVAPAYMRPALALMMFVGLGPGDALALPRTFYKQGEIATRRSKTDVPVFWPAPSALRDVLDGAPVHDAMTLCANSNGKPWTIGGFHTSWRKLRIKLEREERVQAGLTLYGLRHTVAVMLREAGLHERAIADALGQKTIEMARHYAKGADLRRTMADVSAALEKEVNSRSTKLSNRTEKVSNRGTSSNARD